MMTKIDPRTHSLNTETIENAIEIQLPSWILHD